MSPQAPPPAYNPNVPMAQPLSTPDPYVSYAGSEHAISCKRICLFLALRSITGPNGATCVCEPHVTANCDGRRILWSGHLRHWPNLHFMYWPPWSSCCLLPVWQTNCCRTRSMNDGQSSAARMILVKHLNQTSPCWIYVPLNIFVANAGVALDQTFCWDH